MIMETKALVWKEGDQYNLPFTFCHTIVLKRKKGKTFILVFEDVRIPARTFSLSSWFLSFSQIYRCLTIMGSSFTFSHYRNWSSHCSIEQASQSWSYLATLLGWGRNTVSIIQWVPRSHKPTQRANSMQHKVQQSMAHKYNAYFCFYVSAYSEYFVWSQDFSSSFPSSPSYSL